MHNFYGMRVFILITQADLLRFAQANILVFAFTAPKKACLKSDANLHVCPVPMKEMLEIKHK